MKNAKKTMITALSAANQKRIFDVNESDNNNRGMKSAYKKACKEKPSNSEIEHGSEYLSVPHSVMQMSSMLHLIILRKYDFYNNEIDMGVSEIEGVFGIKFFDNQVDLTGHMSAEAQDGLTDILSELAQYDGYPDIEIDMDTFTISFSDKLSLYKVMYDYITSVNNDLTISEVGVSVTANFPEGCQLDFPHDSEANGQIIQETRQRLINDTLKRFDIRDKNYSQEMADHNLFAVPPRDYMNKDEFALACYPMGKVHVPMSLSHILKTIIIEDDLNPNTDLGQHTQHAPRNSGGYH